jgi:hypothetical protein
MKKVIIALAVISLCSCSSKFQGYGTWANDIVGGTDQQFTNGFEIGVQIPAEAMEEGFIEGIYTIPSLRISANDPTEVTAARISVGNEMYTPDDIRNTEIIKDENPFAGVTSFRVTKIQSIPGRAISTEIEAGVSGDWSHTDDLQRFVHNDLGFGADPGGWENQIGSEPVLNYNWTREVAGNKRTFFKLEFLNIDGQIVRVGNKHTDATIYKSFRVGHNVQRPGESSDDYSIFLEVTPWGKVVAHNIFYDGALFADNPHTIDSERFVGGITNGIVLQKGNYSLRFDYHIRTPEFDDSETFHKFGILSFGVKW